MDFLFSFISALDKAGIAAVSPVVGDGRLRRYQVVGDHKGRKNGWYRLTIDGDFAFGAFGSWKHSVNEKWYSKSEREYTPVDREKLARKRKEIEEQEIADQKAAAARAAGIWGKASACEDHPYAVKKGITLHGVRESRGMLLVPVYRRDSKMTLTSLQFISPDGEKKFLTGGQVQGCYMTIAASGSSKEVLYICEGYATGASIFEATGMPVIVAYNSNNLKPVAETIRANNPDATITIAADNDQWTKRQDGSLWNPGITAAREAARAIGNDRVRVTWPVFAANDADRATDFNDLHRRAGLDAVRDGLLNSPDEKAAPPPPPPMIMHEVAIGEPPPMPQDNHQEVADRKKLWMQPTDWRQLLLPGKVVVQGYPHPYNAKSKKNAFYFLKHHPEFVGMFVHNEFTNETMILRCPPWEDDAKFAPRRLTDTDAFMIAAELESYEMQAGKETAYDAAMQVAKCSSVNPPKDYFENLKWDGQPRIDNWLTYFMGAEEQPGEYLKLVGSKWLIAAVSRIYNPGSKFDSVLVLEGTQGLGKSLALRTLATFHGEEYFSDSSGKIGEKDTVMGMQGKIIVEMAELASFKKSENEEIKAFITRQIDEYRPPYGKGVISRPRYFVLAASTNEIDEGYLTDHTGGRRYWPVKCNKIDIKGLEEAREQLWAEACYRMKMGERTWLNDSEIYFATKEQYSRMIEDAWQQKISEILAGESIITIDWVFDKMDLKARDRTQITRQRVKNSLRALDWNETKKDRKRVWRPLAGGRADRNPDQQDLLDSIIE